MTYFKTIENFYNLSPSAQRIAQHDAGIALLKQSVLREYGVEIADEDIAVGKHGKPYFKNHTNIHFSISHCKEHIAVLLSARPCGVDIELVRHIKPRLIERFCTENEQRQLHDSDNADCLAVVFWTLKESYVKALGRGIGFGLRNIEFTLNGNMPIGNADAEFQTEEKDGLIIARCILNA